MIPFFTRKKPAHSQQYLASGRIGEVIRFLTLSDILIMGGIGLITPIFAVFVTDHIENGTVEVAGLSTAIYLLTRSIFQVPIARFIDKKKGERDDFWAMFIGSLGVSLVPLLYIPIYLAWHLYLIQFVYGFFAALTFPSWMAIFTRHIDKDKEGLEWGVYRTLIDLSGAATASLGGFMAYRFGFTSVFIVISIFSFIGTFFLLSVYHDMSEGSILTKK